MKLALAWLLAPALAGADASLPSSVRKAARGNDWQNRCRSVFEGARADVARTTPLFADGVMEMGATNDDRRFPWVEYQLKAGQYPARSVVYTAWAEQSGIWGARPWAEKGSAHPGEFMVQRSTKRHYGWVALRRIGELTALDDQMAERFRKTFERAVDGCLALEDSE